MTGTTKPLNPGSLSTFEARLPNENSSGYKCFADFSSIKTKYRPIFDLLRAGKFELVVSNDILLEYHEKISEKASPQIAENVLKFILSLENCTLQSTFFEWGLMHNDEDDNKYTDCALVACADHLVSEDRHFNILKDIDFPKLSVIRADDFLELVTHWQH